MSIYTITLHIQSITLTLTLTLAPSPTLCTSNSCHSLSLQPQLPSLQLPSLILTSLTLASLTSASLTPTSPTLPSLFPAYSFPASLPCVTSLLCNSVSPPWRYSLTFLSIMGRVACPSPSTLVPVCECVRCGAVRVCVWCGNWIYSHISMTRQDW